MTEQLVPQPTTPAAGRKKFSPAALVSLISGILSYALLFLHSLVNMSFLWAAILAPLTSLIAVFSGGRAKRQIRRSEGALAGKKMANAGLWLGWLYLIGCLVILVLAVLIGKEIVQGIAGIFG